MESKADVLQLPLKRSLFKKIVLSNKIIATTAIDEATQKLNARPNFECKRREEKIELLLLLLLLLPLLNPLSTTMAKLAWQL